MDGTGALLVFADWDLSCDPIEDCDFLVTSRTYTVDPVAGIGEFGQTIPGSSTWQGIDWDTLGYAAGILNDGVSFRANLGITSWSGDWTTVMVDVQDSDGVIVESLSYEVPPFGHVQERLAAQIEGGSVVIWLEDGPADALVFGYVSVVDESTGDPASSWHSLRRWVLPPPRRPRRVAVVRVRPSIPHADRVSCRPGCRKGREIHRSLTGRSRRGMTGEDQQESAQATMASEADLDLGRAHRWIVTNTNRVPPTPRRWFGRS